MVDLDPQRRLTPLAMAAVSAISMAEAAAASVPFSSTFTKSLWKTRAITSRCAGLGGFAMPVEVGRLGVEGEAGHPQRREIVGERQRLERTHLELRQRQPDVLAV